LADLGIAHRPSQTVAKLFGTDSFVNIYVHMFINITFDDYC